MFEFVPDTERMSQIFQNATAPTFFLGAVAAFASLMTSRKGTVLARIQLLNAIPETDQTRAPLKADIQRLFRRATLLKSGIIASLYAGICTTLLLANLFVTEFLEIKYAYGAGLLFLIATIFLAFALLRFAQEVHISVDEADQYS